MKTEIVLEMVGLIIQITSSVFVVIAGIIGIRTYIRSKKKELYLYEKERVQTAIKVAEYYKENVLKPARQLKEIMIEIGFFKVNEEIQSTSIKHFDVYELDNIYSTDVLQRMEELRKEYYINREVTTQEISYRGANDAIEDSGRERGESSQDRKMKLGKEYTRCMIETLNNMEVVSMYFVHEAADETVVYQSLHMSFLEIVRMLYYDIAFANRNGEDKYFVNTIKLFNVWNERAEERKSAEIASIRDAVEHGKILEY